MRLILPLSGFVEGCFALQPYHLNGKAITNPEEYAEESLVSLARTRSDSAADFVTVHDITFAALYRAGVTKNGREYFKAGCAVNPQTGNLEFANMKNVFLNMGMSEAEAETKNKAWAEIYLRLTANKRSNHDLVMNESLLFISGVVPFDEYSAKWIEVSGTGPPESTYSTRHLNSIKRHFAEKFRISTEKYVKQFLQRYNTFEKVVQADIEKQQAFALPHEANGKGITNGQQFADERLVWLSRYRSDSAAAFVTGYDIFFAALYRAGVTHNVREYLKAVLDTSEINARTGHREFANMKNVFLNMGMSEAEAETKSEAMNEIFLRLKANKRSNHFLIMFESLFFISGAVPFDEYSAKWVELSGAGPPETGLRFDHLNTISKHFKEKMCTSTEKYWKQFVDRFVAFSRVCKADRVTRNAAAEPQVGHKRPAATQPATAPAAQRPRTVTTSKQAVNSVQALVNEQSSLKQKVDLQESTIRQLRHNLARDQAMVAQRNATIEQLTTQNRDLQTSLQASNAANQELAQRNASLETQVQQLQEEIQRLKSGTRGYATVKQEIKQETGIKKEEPNAGIDRPPN